MGSYAGRDNVHDFDVEKENDMRDTRSFPKSGLKAGVENGLSEVESLVRGAVQSQQQTNNNVFRQESIDEPLKSDIPGKTFKIRY
jgi:hypothetical protein